MIKRKQKHKYSNKRRLSERQAKPKAGDITKYIQQYDSRNKRHQQYFFQIVARVSTEGQRKHLTAQIERIRCWADIFDLRDRLIPSDFRVVASLLQLGNEKEISKGMKGLHKSRYGWLADIAGRVWPLQFHLPDMKFALLFESKYRAVRSDSWTPENQDAPISKERLEEFAAASLHLPIFVIRPVDEKSAKTASYRSNLELFLKQRRKLLVRRPTDLKGEYDEFHDYSIELQLEGRSHGYISDLTGMPIERIRSWWLKNPQYYPKPKN